MAEHEADREPEETPPGELGKGLGAPLGDGELANGAAGDGPAVDDEAPAFDEEAAWAAIVAGYGEEPPDPPGAKPFKSIEDLALPEKETNDVPGPDGPEGLKVVKKGSGPDSGDDGDTGNTDADTEADSDENRAKGRKDAASTPGPLGSSVSFAPGVGGGPRDYSAPEPTEDDFEADDEGHFVPPEPPPLPAADTTAKFAWLAVLGGPVLLLLAVVLGWNMTWWLATIGIGGFLGGFATLVTRMKSDDDEDDDPGRGAVV